MADEGISLRDRYSALSDDELQNLAVTGGLTDQARELLEQELRRRGIEDVSEYREYLERVDRERLERSRQRIEQKEKYIRLYSRIGYSITSLGILAGLFVRYVQKDEINGTGIIIACVIVFPLVWIIAQIRRVIWRFLLRP
jgi:ElaB/YqjD/DUF883 family membrane-anchored ribosome-binding protein